MKIKDSDIELICSLTRDIANRHKLIMQTIPEETVYLKHLSASCLHMSIFLDDFLNYVNKKEREIKEVQKFLRNCECGFNKKEGQ